MAEYVSNFIYALIQVSSSVPRFELGPPIETVGTSTGGADESFAPGDTIQYADEYVSLEYLYAGFNDDGYVGREVLNDFPSEGEKYITNNYYFMTNDGSREGESFDFTSSGFTVCFLSGTQIRALDGERPIEDLSIGDYVLCSDGRLRPVRFVGRQTIVKTFADLLSDFPVRIRAGALGEGMPARDLHVSPDHALMLDGVLVQAGALVNGTTIVRAAAMPERFTYYHVELDDHALILAEGVPAETFVDNVTRRRFDNYAEYEALYGEAGKTIPEMDVPRVKSARQLPDVLRARLHARAAASRIGAPAAA